MLLVLLCPCAVNTFALTMMRKDLDGSIVSLLSAALKDPSRLLSEAFPLPNLRAVGFLMSLLLLQLTLLLLVPGPRFSGPRAPSGHIPQYTDNGFVCFFLTLAVLAVSCVHLGLSPTLIFDELLPILSTLNAGALVLSAILCYKGLHFPSTADSGSSGSLVLDIYWGTELYPRFWNGRIDAKQLLIARFGITLWGLFALSFACKSAALACDGMVPNGQFVSASLMLVYITKFYWWERWYMHAADIQVARLGFMMCWGPICFMPLVHTLQNLYLVHHEGLALSRPAACLYLLLGNGMTLLNYDADTQRHRVRTSDGKCLIWGQPAKVLRAPYTTADGGRHVALLSCCGYQAWSRHFHYLPDIINLFLYCSPAGFSRVLPHLYFIYLTALLLDRTYRIDARCHAKYGKQWEAYCKLVPWRLIPKVW